MEHVILNDSLRPITPYLAHYGIKEMQWYHRRYQNYDGSYTEAGRLRYGIGKKRELKNNVQRRKTAEKLVKYSNKANKLQQKANAKRQKNPRANVLNREQKAEEYRQKQYEKAHELVSESEKLHNAIDAYDIAEDRYNKAVKEFMSNKEAYAKAVEEQIEEDRKHGFYGGTEEEFREFYNGVEGSDTIFERFAAGDEHVQRLSREMYDKEREFQKTAEALYDDALKVFGNLEVDHKKVLGKGQYTLSEELAERELHRTLHGKRDAADKAAEVSNAGQESSEARADKEKASKLDTAFEKIENTIDEAANDIAKKVSSKASEKPEYVDKVETKNGDTRYFYDKDELKAYKDGKSGASEKDLEAAVKKMRNTAKTGEEADAREKSWDRARDKDLWNLDFLEAVQNSVILDQNDRTSLLTEYAKFLSDPSDYWQNERDKLKEL